MNRCIYLFCHHTDGQKMFSCHGSEMYSIADEKETGKKKPRITVFASCCTLAAAAEFEFYCHETSTQNPSDHVSHQWQYLRPVTFLPFAFRALHARRHWPFHL